MKQLLISLILSGLSFTAYSQDELSRKLLSEISENEQVKAFTENRKEVAANPYRPLYHLSAPDKLLHDPNGLCQWKGRYHLFYQYVVKRKGWIVHWGHAYSDDLLHWKDLPVAIKPTVEKSCFSGQTLAEEDRVIAMYHGTQAGNMIATANDPLLLEWDKLPQNPVIPMHTDSTPYRVFDPCIWKEQDGAYYSLSGSYKDGQVRVDCVGETHIFRSTDLVNWEWLGPMYTDTIFAEPGEDMVVPNFWPVGNGKHLLLCFSHKRAGRGYVGDFDVSTARFNADYHFRANHGEFVNASIHAPSANIDDQGRYLAIFNMKEAKGIEHDGWDGIMGLPRVYSLAEDNSLRIHPIEEVKSLRFDPVIIGATTIPDNGELVLDDIGGKSIELKAVIQPNQADEVGLKVLRSEDDREYASILYSRSDQQISIHSYRSSLNESIEKRSPEKAPLQLDKDEPLELRIFIDRSVVEVFANGRQCIAVRVYPTLEGSRGVSLMAKGGAAKLMSLESWQMHAVWPELEYKEGE